MSEKTAADYARELLEVTDEWAPAGDIDPGKLAAALAAAEERGRRRGIEEMQLGTCRVYRHGCADGRAIENSVADRWREYALPHPKREHCLEWVALAAALRERLPQEPK